MRQLRRLFGATLGLVGFIACVGCSYRVDVRDREIVEAPKAPPARILIRVNKEKNNNQGEAHSLENGLKREFHEAGYEVDSGDLRLDAELIEVHRGSTVANVIIGLGAGADHADVSVLVSDESGRKLMSFVVRGTAVDKRYSELNGVLFNHVARRIVEEIKKARP